MLDLRPVAYVIGLLVAALGAAMLFPMVVDLANGNGHAWAFAEAAIITLACGGLVALATANSPRAHISIQQTVLITTGVWLALPVFGAIPFVIGATEARYADAFFEAMSGLTTTGSTVFSGLDEMPRGLLYWRSMLQWFGGIGIIVGAMVFLPEIRVGGMQMFRSEGFETEGKVLPRAAEIASQISVVYFALTAACILAFLAVGMDGFEAVNHALTTVSTGGFSTHDASFGMFQGPAEYVASVFMVLASLPFVRFVQLLAGNHRPLLRDTQVRTFLWVILVMVAILLGYRIFVNGDSVPHSLREAVFNGTSILTGTGFASVDYERWGPFPVAVIFFAGLIGGCAGSTCCSVKIFRYQLLFSSIITQIRRIHTPHGIFQPRYAGRPVSEDVLSSVMFFFVLFVLSLGVTAILLALTGLDFTTSLSGAATAIANIGPGLGDIIGPSGNFAPLSETAKWILSAAMLVGRLELMAVYVLFLPRFWRG